MYDVLFGKKLSWYDTIGRDKVQQVKTSLQALVRQKRVVVGYSNSNMTACQFSLILVHRQGLWPSMSCCQSVFRMCECACMCDHHFRMIGCQSFVVVLRAVNGDFRFPQSHGWSQRRRNIDKDSEYSTVIYSYSSYYIHIREQYIPMRSVSSSLSVQFPKG